jgi:hypothetical protein
MCLNTWFHRVHQVWVPQILWYLGSHLHANLCYSSRNVEILKKKKKKEKLFSNEIVCEWNFLGIFNIFTAESS